MRRRLGPPGRIELKDVEIYTSTSCGPCIRAKALLKAKGVAFREIDISSDVERQREMIERSQRRTVPQIFIGGEPIGGYDDLARLNARGELDGLLGKTEPKPPTPDGPASPR